MLQWWERMSQQPVVAHLLRTVERFNVRGGPQFAAALAYFSLLALVPVLMLAFSALSLTVTVLRPELLVGIEAWITDNIQTSDAFGRQLAEVVNGALSNWAAIGSTGLAIAVWTGAGWIGNLKRAVRVLMREDVDNPQGQLPMPLDIAVNFAGLIGLLVGVGATFAASTAATSLASLVGDLFGFDHTIGWSLALRALSLVVSLAAGFGLFWWLFAWFSPRPLRPGQLAIAAGAAAVALVLLQSLAGYLIQTFSRNISVSLFGSAIVVLLFLNLFATLILYVASWLATDVAPVAEPEVVEDESVAPAAEQVVSAQVAQRSMGVGLSVGYGVGTATGLGLGALLTALLRSRRKP